MRRAGIRYRLRTVKSSNRGIPACWSNGHDTDGLARQALAVIADRAAYRPLGEAASLLVREHYSQDVCMPRLAERFTLSRRRQGERP